jgi:uncharacterized surface protein with fasciclin (FAS1) repeats
MKNKINILVIAFCVLLIGCKDWDEHYNDNPATSNENVWDALQKDPSVSSFVNYLKQYQYDTLFLTNNTYTIFAPTNEAFTQFLNTGDSINEALLAYHISKYYVQTTAIEGKRKIQTFAEKYALFNNVLEGAYLDDIPLSYESPLYKNGKYYVMDQVAKPKPNLYEYIALTNPVLKAYIDSEDSVILDKKRSTPIGFDEYGNTIYDTVADIINMFELEYFEVSEEFRNKTATIVFPKEENYNAALTEMAISLNAGYVDYRDIPMDWQNKILIPYLLERGVFENMLEREEFLKKSIKDTVKLKNILGDSVVIDYEPGEKTICSNGYAYNYYDFKVPDTLYKAPVKFEAEWLLKTQGSSFSWYPGVYCEMSTLFPAFKDIVPTASNDTVMRVSFTKGYLGTFSLSFNIKTLFPRKYLAVFRINITKGGIYDIYMNNQFLRRFDYGTDISTYGVINSVITGKKYYPVAGYNRFDCWVDNLENYGQAVMRFEYRGPSTVTSNGITLDYVEFKPY